MSTAPPHVRSDSGQRRRVPVSVVVPAHNEASTIGSTLASIMSQLQPDDEIAVVCNGCTDRTAAIATDLFGDRVTVVELEVSSKIAALNHGDALVRIFPRIYVDADVRLSPGTIDALARSVSSGAIDLASPVLDIDTSHASAPVKQYMRIWEQLPSVRADTVGRGVYALSRAGRASFDSFPDVMGDDHFVRDCVSPERRAILAEVSSTVTSSGNLRGLLRRKPRTVSGNRQLDRTTHLGRRRSGIRSRQWLGVLRRHPSLATGLPVYLFVSIWARTVVWARSISSSDAGWGRDDTSR